METEARMIDEGSFTDLSAAASWLEIVFEDAPEGAYVERRVIDPVSKRAQQSFWPVSDVANLIDAQLDGKANVYVGICPRAREGGKAADVVAASCLWVDDPTVEPSALLPTPTMVVETSPGKSQMIWRLQEWTSDLDRIERLNGRLRDALGGDNVQDRARVLRLPGFLNMKPEHPSQPRARMLDTHPFLKTSLDEMETALGADTRLKSTASDPANGRSPLGRLALEFVANGATIGKQRSRALAATRNYLGAGYSEEATVTAIWRGLLASPVGRPNSPWTFEDALEIVKDLVSKPGRQTTLESNGHRPLERPVINVTGRYNRDITSDALNAMGMANGSSPRFFSQGAVSVRLKGDEGHRVAERMSPDVFSSEVDRVADFIKITRDGEVPTAPPMRVVRDALVQNPPFPPLRSIVRTPVFSRDGAVLSTSGYDVQSEIYLDGQPWIDDVRTDIPLPDALALIFDELLADFPLAADADRAHALALLVTPFVRRMIEGPVPLFLLEAPTRGTGKTLFAETIGQIVIGESVAAMPLPRPDEEIDKRITAHLIQAPVVTLLDNVTQLTSPVLAALLTSTRWRGRILGFSEMVDVANETVWLATGNNVTLSEELARRVVRIRLDAQVESPELRNGFKHDLPSWASQQRAELVSAILSLTQHWLHSGSPAFERVSLGKFEEWARTVGGIVECAGIHGFLSDRTHIASKDQQDWRRLVVLWFESHGTRPVAAGQVLQLLRMEDLLMDLWAGRSDLAALQRVGKALARNIDRAFGDYFVRSGGTGSRTRNNTYRLEHRTPETPETPRAPIEGSAAAGIGAGVSSHEVGNIDGNTETTEQAAAGPNAAAGVSGVSLAVEQNFDAHTSEPRRTNPSEAELFIDDAPALDEPVGMSKGEVFFGLQCGITGKRCDLCRGIPCAGSIPLDGVNG
jgi:hypothetical protein